MRRGDFQQRIWKHGGMTSTAGDGSGQHRADQLAVYLIALEEARAAFADLMAQPEKIRRNVAGLLGFAAIAVSIFGFAAARPTSVLGWIVQVGALVGIVSLAVTAAYVTFPAKLIPSMKADQIVGWGDEGDGEAAAVRNLALAYEKSVCENQPGVRRIFRAQIAATVFFGIAVIMLAVRLTGV
jgi:hypothetical protein